jgi:UDP-glucose 4-epimerase
MKRVLVTGAGGYIGSRVVLVLRDKGFDVTAAVRRQASLVRSQLGVQVVELDVSAPGDFFRGKTFDVVVHCATANDIVSRQFRDGVDLSVSGTWNMLEIARHCGSGHFLFFSTFQVYGTELNGKVDEDTPVCCESPYGLNHWFGEEACRLHSRLHGTRVAVLRPSNVYGVPAVSTVERSTLVPTCFVREALERGSVSIRSSGRQIRNFVSTTEVANAVSYLLEKASNERYLVFNVCSRLHRSIAEVASLTCDVFREVTGSELPLSILGEEPSAENLFEATSRGVWPIQDERSAWKAMRSELQNLFVHYRNNVPKLYL